MKRLVFTLAIAAASLPAAPVTFSAAGANSAAIQTTVDAFRTALGTLNPNSPGSFGSGRREINWDGVPAAQFSPNNLNPNFFNSNSPRGAVFSTAGTGFQVSGNDDPLTGTDEARFGNLNIDYPSQFQTFSPVRLFTSLGNNVLDVNFFIPGSSTPATVSGFGAVFTDVDLAGTTKVDFFDANGGLIQTLFAGVQNGGLSFVGLSMSSPGDPRIGSVRLTMGNAIVGQTENPTAVEFASDVVVADDFIYGEPIADTVVPEPSSLMMLSGGLLLGALGLRKRL